MNLNKYLIRIFVGIAVVTVCATLALTYLGFRAVAEIDADSFARERSFAASGIQAETDRLQRQQGTSTVSNEAVQHVLASDAPWINAHLGVALQTYFGHDEVYIVAPDGQIIYEMKPVPADQAPVAAPGVGALREPLERLVDTARDRIRTAIHTLDDSSSVVAADTITDIVRLDDLPAFVSVRPIVPDTSGITQPPGSEYLHIAVQYADQKLAERVSRTNGLVGAHFYSDAPLSGGLTGIPLVDRSGAVVGMFAWVPDRPGHRLTEKMAPAITQFGLLCLLLFAGLLVWIQASARRLSNTEARADFLSQNDPLARLANRSRFVGRLARALDQEEAGGPLVTILSVNLDNFKTVNDAHGRAAGDQMIQMVSERLRSHVGDADTVARLGGDEFGVLLLGIRSEEFLQNLSEELVAVLSEPYFLSESESTISASIGVARSREVPGGIEPLMRAADAALREAKGAGKARYCIFTAEMDARLRRRDRLDRDLREAIATGLGLSVVFQPILDGSGTLSRVEALTRWLSPDGPVAPDLFFSIAEENGCIQELGRRALQEACAVGVALNLPKVAVNVSALQLRDKGFVAEVEAALKKSELPASRLELELTERCAMDSGSVTQDNLRSLRALGISVALDDFATGKSLLQYVRDFEIDAIKIDRSFVQRITRHDGTEQIVRALLDLAGSMGLEVIAEGVETEEQYAALRTLGCDLFQGFLLARPMSKEMLAEFVSGRAAA